MRWLISLLRQAIPTAEREPELDTDEIHELAQAAPGDTVTSDVLANRDHRTATPLVEYIAADEQPEYVFRGSRLLIGDPDGTTTRNHPSRELLVVFSDQRLLFIVGGRLTDDLLELPLADVVETYLDEAGVHRYLVVEADREDDPMTFFADVTIEPNVEELRSVVDTRW